MASPTQMNGVNGGGLLLNLLRSSVRAKGTTHKMAWGSKICVGMLVFVGYFQSWCTGEVLSFDKI